MEPLHYFTPPGVLGERCWKMFLPQVHLVSAIDEYVPEETLHPTKEFMLWALMVMSYIPNSYRMTGYFAFITASGRSSWRS